MQSVHELTSHVQSEVSSLLKREPPEIQKFYNRISNTDTELSWELMAEIAPEWNSFSPVVVNGETIAYTKAGYSIEPSRAPWVIMPDAPSAGGKTTLLRSLVQKYEGTVQILKTCTTRAPQVEEQKTVHKEFISDHPIIEAITTAQYWHVSDREFTDLQRKNFFIETRSMWRSSFFRSAVRYGIPQIALTKTENGSIPFSLLAVDEYGQANVTKWVHDHASSLNLQKWFLLPTHQRFADLVNRITFQRTEQAAPRIIDAIHDLWKGAGRTDLIFLYPFESSGYPSTAIERAKQLMDLLHPPE